MIAVVVAHWATCGWALEVATGATLLLTEGGDQQLGRQPVLDLVDRR